MSKNLKRTPYGAATKIRVREMREAGYSVVQITGATGVPGSTIARWAAEGGWRVSDLVEEPEFVDPVSEPEGRLRDAPPSPLMGEGTGVREIEGCDFPELVDTSASPLIPNPHSDNRLTGSIVPPREPQQGEKGLSQQTNTKPGQSRQERLEDALEKAAFAAEDAIMRGNFTAAGKAVQMADTLSKALERVRASAAEERPDGVFFTREQIDDARAELTRRVNRLAEKLRTDAMEASGEGQ